MFLFPHFHNFDSEQCCKLLWFLHVTKFGILQNDPFTILNPTNLTSQPGPVDHNFQRGLKQPHPTGGFGPVLVVIWARIVTCEILGDMLGVVGTSHIQQVGLGQFWVSFGRGIVTCEILGDMLGVVCLRVLRGACLGGDSSSSSSSSLRIVSLMLTRNTSWLSSVMPNKPSIVNSSYNRYKTLLIQPSDYPAWCPVNRELLP